MSEGNLTYNGPDDEIDLKELFSVLWLGKIKIIVITAVFAVGSVFHALSIPNQYKATTLLAPANSDETGLSSALGQVPDHGTRGRFPELSSGPEKQIAPNEYPAS